MCGEYGDCRRRQPVPFLAVGECALRFRPDGRGSLFAQLSGFQAGVCFDFALDAAGVVVARKVEANQGRYMLLEFVKALPRAALYYDWVSDLDGKNVVVDGGPIMASGNDGVWWPVRQANDIAPVSPPSPVSFETYALDGPTKVVVSAPRPRRSWYSAAERSL